MNNNITSNPQSLDKTINGGKLIRPSVTDITLDWVASTQNNSESHGELSQVALRMIDTYDNIYFNENNFLMASHFLDLSAEIITAFFKNWISFLHKGGYVKILPPNESVYSHNSYLFIK